MANPQRFWLVHTFLESYKKLNQLDNPDTFIILQDKRAVISDRNNRVRYSSSWIRHLKVNIIKAHVCNRGFCCVFNGVCDKLLIVRLE